MFFASQVRHRSACFSFDINNIDDTEKACCNRRLHLFFFVVLIIAYIVLYEGVIHKN